MTEVGDAPEADAVPRLLRGMPGAAQFNRHEWGVLAPLSLVGFFTNYDTGLVTFAAPDIADGLEVSVATFGVGVAIIRLAALGNVLTLRLADRRGRRTLLIVSVIGFTLATGLTAVAWGLIAFVVFQFVSRLFLATEEALASVVLTEELRPDRRGAGIAMLGVLATAGYGLVALLLLAENNPLGWRLYYVVALIPLVVVAYLRRNLNETKAFAVASDEARLQTTFWPRVGREDRARLARITLLVGGVGVLSTSAFFYASELAQDEFGWEGLFTVIVLAAAPTTLGGFVLGGRLSDRFGRKPVVAASSVLFAVGVLILFTEQRALFPVGFYVMTGSDAALQAARAAYISEMFPTEVRATLGSFVGAIVVAGGSVGLIAVGAFTSVAEPNVTISVGAVLAAVTVLILRRMPETVGVDVVEARE